MRSALLYAAVVWSAGCYHSSANGRSGGVETGGSGGSYDSGAVNPASQNYDAGTSHISLMPTVMTQQVADASTCGTDTKTCGPCDCKTLRSLDDQDGGSVQQGLSVTAFEDAMIGEWIGERSSPWDGTHKVSVEFLGDRTYRAECADCAAFYWGSNAEAKGKVWRIDTVNGRGEASGHLSVFFEAGNSQEGEISLATLRNSSTRLVFDFWALWSGRTGPVTFALDRR